MWSINQRNICSRALSLGLIAVSGPVGRYPMEPSSPRSPETSGPRRVCGENRNTLTGKTRSADRGSDMPLEHAQWLRRPGLRPKLPKPAMRGACTGVDHGPASPDRLHQHPQACSGLQGTPQVWPSTTSVARTLLMPTPQPRLTLQIPQLHAEQTAAWHEPDRSQDRVRRHGARSRYLPPACPPTCRSCRRSRMRNLRGDPMPRPAWLAQRPHSAFLGQTAGRKVHTNRAPGYRLDSVLSPGEIPARLLPGPRPPSARPLPMNYGLRRGMDQAQRRVGQPPSLSACWLRVELGNNSRALCRNPPGQPRPVRSPSRSQPLARNTQLRSESRLRDGTATPAPSHTVCMRQRFRFPP